MQTILNIIFVLTSFFLIRNPFNDPKKKKIRECEMCESLANKRFSNYVHSG